MNPDFWLLLFPCHSRNNKLCRENCHQTEIFPQSTFSISSRHTTWDRLFFHYPRCDFIYFRCFLWKHSINRKLSGMINRSLAAHCSMRNRNSARNHSIRTFVNLWVFDSASIIAFYSLLHMNKHTRPSAKSFHCPFQISSKFTIPVEALKVPPAKSLSCVAKVHNSKFSSSHHNKFRSHRRPTSHPIVSVFQRRLNRRKRRKSCRRAFSCMWEKLFSKKRRREGNFRARCLLFISMNVNRN